MAALNITVLNHGQEDLAHIAEIANSVAATAIDRMGRTKKTLQGAIESIESFNSRGTWESGVMYESKDLVLLDGTWWAAVLAHRSSDVFMDDEINWRIHQGVVKGDLLDPMGSSGIGNGPTTLDRQVEPYDLNAFIGASNLLPGVVAGGTVQFFLGDSKTHGVGAPTLMAQSIWQITRSAMNAQRRGGGQDHGYGYATRLDMDQAIREPAVSHTGMIIPAGFVSSRLSLAVGQYIEVSQREVLFFGAYVDASASTGAALDVYQNGMLAATLPVSGAGIRLISATFPYETSLTDSLVLRATGGPVQICGLFQAQYSPNGCEVFAVGASGYAYQDYATPAGMDEIAGYCTAAAAGRPVWFTILLGTNSIYSEAKSLTPTDMVAALHVLKTGLQSRLPQARFTIEIPEKSDEATVPIIFPGYTFTDYTNALIDYCRANQLGMIRNDQSINSLGLDYVDGVHNSPNGHITRARAVTRAMGVKYDPYFKSVSVDLAYERLRNRKKIEPVYVAPYGHYGGFVALGGRARENLDTISFSGLVSVNGAGGRVICSFPTLTRVTQVRYVSAVTNAGVINLIFTTDNILKIRDDSAIPAGFISLDNIVVDI